MSAILLVPSPEWRSRLLGDGACGSRPPIVQQPYREGMCEQVWTAGRLGYEGYDVREALPLVWDGWAVAEACDRLTRAINAACPLGAMMVDRPDERRARYLADYAAELGIGTVVVIP